MLNSICLNESMNDPISQLHWVSSKGIQTCMHLSGFKSQPFEWALKGRPFQRDPAFFLWGCSNRCTCVLLFTDYFDYATPTRCLLQYSLFQGWWRYDFLESIINISISSFFLSSFSRVETYLELSSSNMSLLLTTQDFYLFPSGFSAKFRGMTLAFLLWRWTSNK